MSSKAALSYDRRRERMVKRRFAMAWRALCLIVVGLGVLAGDASAVGVFRRMDQ